MPGTIITYQTMSERIRKVIPTPDATILRIKAMMTRAMLRGLNLARRPTNTPKLTGQLIRGISVTPVTRSGQELRSTMIATVEYARRQEFEHPTKSHYLLRGIQRAADDLETTLGDARNVLDVSVEPTRS